MAESPQRNRKSSRNREMLVQRRDGMSCKEIAHRHGLSPSRVSVILEREAWLAEREAELALADTLPVQPNPLHLLRGTRQLVADVLGHDDFTRDQVLAMGVGAFYRQPECLSENSRDLRAWLARP